MTRVNRTLVLLAVSLLAPAAAQATPDFVEHRPGSGVYGESAGVTMREEEVPREDELVQLWVRIGYSNYYTDVAIYYTIDGTDPQGSFGTPANGLTSVLRSSNGGITFIRNEPHSPANIDWWRATLPASTRTYGPDHQVQDQRVAFRRRSGDLRQQHRLRGRHV